MKRLLWILILLTFCASASAEEVKTIQSNYMYNEIVLEMRPWPFLGTIVYGDNFANEKYVSVRVTPWKPLRETRGGIFLDAGITGRDISYQEWDENSRTLFDREKQLFEIFLSPEINLNIPPQGIHARVRSEHNIGKNYIDSLFLGQLRWFPNAWFQNDIVYCYARSSNRDGIRTKGENANVRFRTGFCFGKVFETGIQISSEFYKDPNWESQYRPRGGFYFRLLNMPGWLKYFWFEGSYEKMRVEEIDMRVMKTQPRLEQNRVLFAFGFSQDPNLANLRSRRNF